MTFEIDANGILNVEAQDKGTGKAEKITITNDKGRLTEEQIEQMIRDAEKFADEDKKTKERLDAKNAFDNYLHSMRNTVEGTADNKGLSEKIDEDEKEKIMEAIKEGEDWLASNAETAEADEIRAQQKETESVCAPIISKYYQAGAGAEGQDEDEDDDAHDEL